jgi:uncharacterized protein (TIGR03435 family)
MRNVLGIALVVAMFVPGMIITAAQNQPLKFEVASVKPYVESSSGPMDFTGFRAQPGGRFRVAGVNLKTLITYAYRLRDDQIMGGPDWISSDLWEVTAKAAEGSVPLMPKTFDPAVPDMMAQMVQALIEERFHLKMRREDRVLPTYDLVASNGGPKFRLSEDQSPPIPPRAITEPAGPTRRQGAEPPAPPRGTLSMFNTPFSSTLQGKAVPLSYLAGG